MIWRVSSGIEVNPAFLGAEEVADVADGAPEGVDGSGSGF